MFREDTFTFTPVDELVISMNFEFISNLKVVTIESKLATLFHYRTTFLLDC